VQKTAKPIEMPFGLWVPKAHEIMYYMGSRIDPPWEGATMMGEVGLS